MPFQDRVEFIQNSEEVAAGVANRVGRVNDANIRYLKSLIDEARLCQIVLAREQTIESEAAVGMAVYWNPETDQFERALAQTDTDLANDALVVADSAQAWGVVRTKSGTLADILLFGFDELDIEDALETDETVQAGLYYLSGTTAGKLTRTRPGATVPVLRATGDGHVFVLSGVADFLTRHTHHRHELRCRPAGTHTPPTPGERHEITDADDELVGWLPADHASFENHAPPNARFGYNLAADASLNALWPPLPLSGAYLELDRGEPDQGGHGVPSGPLGAVIIDRYGIWWLSDCYDDVPWPTDFDSSTSLSSTNSGSGAECPRWTTMRATLWFSRPAFGTDTSAVTSLVSLDERLTLTCQGTTTEASVGALAIDLDLGLTLGADDDDGFLALKTFNSTTETFDRGPVMTGLYTEGTNVSLTGQDEVEVPGDPTQLMQVGAVRIEVDTNPSQELNVQIVRLDRVQEEYFDGTYYLEFPAEQESSYRGQIAIPSDLLLADPQLQLRFWVLGRAAGTLPELTLTYRRYERPEDDTPVDLPDTDTSLTIDTELVLTDADQYVEVLSNPIEVAAGDMVVFELTRAEDDDYAGHLGILLHQGLVEATS